MSELIEPQPDEAEIRREWEETLVKLTAVSKHPSELSSLERRQIELQIRHIPVDMYFRTINCKNEYRND